jgi:hypothetical protein
MWVIRLPVTAKVLSSQILVTSVMETIRSSETPVLTTPHGVTSQKTALFIVTAVKTSILHNNRLGSVAEM